MESQRSYTVAMKGAGQSPCSTNSRILMNKTSIGFRLMPSYAFSPCGLRLHEYKYYLLTCRSLVKPFRHMTSLPAQERVKGACSQQQWHSQMMEL